MNYGILDFYSSISIFKQRLFNLSLLYRSPYYCSFAHVKGFHTKREFTSIYNFCLQDLPLISWIFHINPLYTMGISKGLYLRIPKFSEDTFVNLDIVSDRFLLSGTTQNLISDNIFIQILFLLSNYLYVIWNYITVSFFRLGSIWHTLVHRGIMEFLKDELAPIKFSIWVSLHRFLNPWTCPPSAICIRRSWGRESAGPNFLHGDGIVSPNLKGKRM